MNSPCQNRQTIQIQLGQYKAMLNCVGIKCEKWFNRKNVATSDAFPWPILLSSARERDDDAVSGAYTIVKASPEFASSGPMNPPFTPAQKAMLNAVRVQVLTNRHASGEGMRALATTLGHAQEGGQFWWERNSHNRMRRRFIYGRDCILCGLTGHDIPTCPQYLARLPFVDFAQAQAPAQAPLVQAPHQFTLQGTFSGISTVSEDGKSVAIEIINVVFPGHYEHYAQVDITGASLGQRVQEAGVMEEDERED